MSTSYVLHYYIFRGNQLAFEYCQGTKQQSYTGRIVKKLPIVYPLEIIEQEAIATALTDIDNLIQSLEKLIDKKRQIKQGAMQQLLTGVKRLPGFCGEWAAKRIGDLFEIYAGGDLDVENYSGFVTDKHRYPIYSNGLVNKGIYGFSACYDHLGNSITVTARGTIGHADYRSQAFCAIGRLLVLKPRVELDNSMISETINACLEFAIESTGVPQLTAPQIAKYDIYIPNDYHEQRAIAQVLSSMDSEIESLEHKLEKLKAIKQGMMQELLTGRIRLI
jgi:type I restriction enzyme S subunit